MRHGPLALWALWALSARSLHWLQASALALAPSLRHPRAAPRQDKPNTPPRGTSSKQARGRALVPLLVALLARQVRAVLLDALPGPLALEVLQRGLLTRGGLGEHLVQLVRAAPVPIVQRSTARHTVGPAAQLLRAAQALPRQPSPAASKARHICQKASARRDVPTAASHKKCTKECTCASRSRGWPFTAVYRGRRWAIALYSV